MALVRRAPRQQCGEISAVILDDLAQQRHGWNPPLSGLVVDHGVAGIPLDHEALAMSALPPRSLPACDYSGWTNSLGWIIGKRRQGLVDLHMIRCPVRGIALCHVVVLVDDRLEEVVEVVAYMSAGALNRVLWSQC